MAVNATEVLYLTSGLFKAAPSKAILTDLVKFNGTIDGLAASLGTSPFAVNAFPFSNAEKAKVLAENLLGSTVADKAAAVTALEGILNANGGNVGIAAAAGIRAILSDAAFADAKAQLENRVKVAAAYVDSNKGNEISTSVLDAVTKDAATVTAAIANLSGTTGGNEAGADRVLTTAQDILTGTAGNDNFRAVAGVQQGQQDQTTLNSSDIIDGAAGADAIIVNMTGTTYTGGARIKNIETLQIGNNLNALATFDYNVNQGQNEITEVTKVVYDQINAGESQRVANLLKTGDNIPTLAWTNEANSTAGIIHADFRQSAIEGSSTTLTVELNNVLADVNNAATTGVLNIGAGIETLNIVSAGTSGRNTLNNSGRNDGGTVDIVSAGSSSTTVTEAGNDDGSLTKVVITGSQEFGKAAQVITASTDARYGLTDRNVANDTGISNSTGTLRATSSNLSSVAATVTEVDATGADGGVNIRFTAKQSGADTNVTFKGGKGNDYVEFQQGDINATGGDGNDTFAFINTQNNSTLTTADTIVGGAGTDTIQMGVNGVGSYNLDTTEFNNKSGIDVLDLRGATNTVRLADAFVGAADAGLVVRTDKIVQTSDTNTANVTANANLEDNSTNTVTLTALAANRAVEFIGGSGSDRIVVNEVSLNSNVKLDGGTNLTTTGRFDTITVQDSAVLSRGDLAQVKNFEGIVLVKSDATSARQYTIEVTEAFLNNNSGQNKTLQIGTIAAANQNALNAGDTVTIDVSDLLTAANTFKTTGYDRKLDTTSLTAANVTVNYVANGGAVTAATLQALGLVNTTADASQALVLASAATAVSNTGAPVAAVALTATSNVTGTANADSYTAPVAAVAAMTVNGAGGTDTLTLTDAGTAAIGANTTNIENLVLANGTNTVSFGAAGFNNVTGGTGNDSVDTTNLTATNLTVALGDGNDSLTLVNGIAYTGTFTGGNGTDALVTGAGLTDLSAGVTVTGFETLTLANALGVNVGSNSLLSQFVTINGTAAAGDLIDIFSGSHDVTGVSFGAGFTNGTGANAVLNIRSGATLTIAGDTQLTAANVNFTGAGNLVTTGSLTFAAADTLTGNVTIGGSSAANFTDVGGVARTITGNSAANVIDLAQDGTAVVSTAKTVALGSDAAVDRVVIDGIGTDSAVTTITGFVTGTTNGDIVDLNTAADGGSAVADVVSAKVATTAAVVSNAAANAIANNYILTATTSQINGALTETGNGGAVENAIIAAALTGWVASEFFYVTLDNGTDTGIYRVTNAGASTGVAGTFDSAADFAVTLVGRINGLADVNLLDASNII